MGDYELTIEPRYYEVHAILKSNRIRQHRKTYLTSLPLVSVRLRERKNSAVKLEINGAQAPFSLCTTYVATNTFEEFI